MLNNSYFCGRIEYKKVKNGQKKVFDSDGRRQRYQNGS